MKKLISIVLVLVMVLAFAVPAIAADGVHNNVPYPISWENYLKDENFNAGNWSAVPDPMSLRETGGEYVLWHFQTGPANTGHGSAFITFGDNGTYEMIACGNGSHYAVITPADWDITDLVWETDTVSTQLRLSHTEYYPDEGEVKTVIEITKYIGEYGNLPDEDEEFVFVFNVFPESAYPEFESSPLGTLEYMGSGRYSLELDPGLAEGTYYIVEEKAEGYLLAAPLMFWVDEKGNATFPMDDEYEEVKYIINLPEYGSLEVKDDVLEEYYKEYHKPVYKTYASDETLVSEVRSVKGNVQANQTWNNGFTYVKIDVAAAKADGGVNVGIADSSKANKNKEGNTAIGYSYNVKIDEYNNVLISFDDNLIYASVVARVLTGSAADKFDNAGNHQSVVTGGSLSAFNGWAPKGKNVETYYTVGNETEIVLFVHFGGLSYYETDDEGNRIVTGCELDYTEGPFTRVYTGEDDVNMVVTRSVYNEDLDEFVDVVVYNGSLGKVDELEAGEYTVTVYVGAIEVASKTVAVVPGENTVVDFGDLIIPNYVADPVIICCQDTEWKCPAVCDCGC